MQYHHRSRPSPRHPAGESRKPLLRVDFDRRLKLEFHRSKITSDAGLLAYRDSDEALGLADLGGAALSDLRRSENRRLLLSGLLRQSVFGRLSNLTPADVYFGRGQAILLERERIKRKTIEHRRLQHRKSAA